MNGLLDDDVGHDPRSKRGGRPRGSKNRPGHQAGGARPGAGRKPVNGVYPRRFLHSRTSLPPAAKIRAVILDDGSQIPIDADDMPVDSPLWGENDSSIHHDLDSFSHDFPADSTVDQVRAVAGLTEPSNDSRDINFESPSPMKRARHSDADSSKNVSDSILTFIHSTTNTNGEPFGAVTSSASVAPPASASSHDRPGSSSSPVSPARQNDVDGVNNQFAASSSDTAPQLSAEFSQPPTTSAGGTSHSATASESRNTSATANAALVAANLQNGVSTNISSFGNSTALHMAIAQTLERQGAPKEIETLVNTSPSGPSHVSGPYMIIPGDQPHILGPMDPKLLPNNYNVVCYYVLYERDGRRTRRPGRLTYEEDGSLPEEMPPLTSDERKALKNKPGGRVGAFSPDVMSKWPAGTDMSKRIRAPRKCMVCDSFVCKGRGGQRFCPSYHPPTQGLNPPGRPTSQAALAARRSAQERAAAVAMGGGSGSPDDDEPNIAVNDHHHQSLPSSPLDDRSPTTHTMDLSQNLHVNELNEFLDIRPIPENNNNTRSNGDSGDTHHHSHQRKDKSIPGLGEVDPNLS